MRRFVLPALAFVLAALPAAVSTAEDAPKAPAQPAAEKKADGKTLVHHITYTTKIPTPPEGTKRLEAWVPVPFEDDTQRVLELFVSAPIPFEVTRDPVYGNRMVHVVVDSPKGETVIEWTAKVRKAEDAGQGGGPLDERFLKSDSLAKVDGRAADLAKSLGVDKDGPARERAKKIYDSVLSTMTYDKVTEGWGKGDFERACTVGKGNCSDFAAKFITIARAAKIPARWISSISVTADHVGCSACGYHCYAQFREGDRWIPADPSDARKVLEKDPARAEWFFGHAEATSVILSVGRDLDLAPRQQGTPLNFFWGPYVETDGKPFAVPADNRKYESKVLEQS